jgi:2-polyprenyl-6-methoxyphenol hydroxylase-like FAD-dependent oxidoreductase
MKRGSVLISGASIAGPALAYWLHRYGFAVTVVERAPALRPGGQTVDLRGASRDVVERMGLMPAVRSACVDERGIAYVDADGRWQASLSMEAFGGKGIVSDIEILRGDLARVLYDATRHDVEYLFDDSIADLDERDGGVHVTFERAAPRTFDLVVGADGTHSRVRAATFGDEAQFVHPLGGYTAFFAVPEAVGEEGWLLMHSAPGGRTAAVRPEHGQRAQAMFAFQSPPLRYDRRDVEQQKRLLADVFAGVGWEAPRLLDAMWSAPDFYFDLYAQVKMPHWTRGRVALVGDAAWSPSPLTGMGTGLAIVGAYVLAGVLAAAGGDHRVAFPRYEAALRPYVTQCQKLPPGGVNGIAPKSRTMIRLRTLSTRMMTRWPMRMFVARMFERADGFTLADYAVPEFTSACTDG